MIFTINECPIAQKRHRTRKIGYRTISYDPLSKEKEDMRFLLSRMLISQTGNKKVDEEALYLRYKDFYHVSFVFTCPISKSDRKTLRNEKLKGFRNHEIKYDLDNLEKFYLDCMTGVIFSDDKKVVKLQSEKKWGETGSIEIEIHGFNESKDG